MSNRGKVALLSEASAGRHLCQFESESDPLAESVAVFTAAGLLRGDAVLLISAWSRTDEVLGLLQRDAVVDVASARQSGQLQVRNAQALFDECSTGGVPDLERLKQTLNGVMADIPAEHRRWIRVYGEMVDVLWRAGYPELAIRLEEHWNELLRMHRLSLFCGYTLDSLDERTYSGPFGEIGRTHTNILPTTDDDRFRAAVDAATEDVLGISFSLILSCSAREQTLGEHRLPIGRRTLLWLHRNMPVTSGHILERARHYMNEGAPLAS